MNESLDDETIIRIQTMIEQNPGISLSKVAELLEIKVSIVEQYLSALQREGRIQVALEDGFVRYYRKSEKQDSEETQQLLSTRQKIYGLIAKNPGLHLSTIASQLNMSPALANYHLLQMEKGAQIRSVKGVGGYYKRFYVIDSEVGMLEENLLALLRQKIPLVIVILLWKHPNMQHKELLGELSISKSTLTYHLDKLIEYGIVEQHHFGEEKGYVLKNEQEAIWIIRRYKLNRALDRFKDLWSDLEI